MMRENESDSGSGRPPPERISPWAPRDAGEVGAASPPDDGQDTIAFGSPAGEAGDYPPGSYPPGYIGQAGYGDDAGAGGYGGYSESGYGSGGYSESGHGSGYGSGGGSGYGSGGGSGGYSGSGYGSGQWEPPIPPPPRRSRRGRHFLVYIAVAALAAGIGAGVTVALASDNASPSTGVSSGDVPVPNNNAAGSRSSSSLNEATVKGEVEPGLVDITSTLKYQSETAEGTGMILSASGLVLTNNHVIDGATTVSASLAYDPGQTYQARVVGYDSTGDIAVLQLDGASGLATVRFGNSSQVKVGTAVLALGNAEGRGGVTPAPGYINALNRSIQASDQGSNTIEDLNHMLQTNAQIEQGDSGGALANNAGQVIGMVTAANTSDQYGQSEGTIGFAIPINSALAVARQIASGQASSSVYIGVPGFLGVEVAQSSSSDPRQQAADEQQSGNGHGAHRFGSRDGTGCVSGGQESAVPGTIAPASTGALVVGILCGTPADARGLAAGDVITAVNGQAVTNPGSLTGITARYHPGDVVSVSWEDPSGAKHTTSITLGSGPAR
jgi:S1-C subfamily serine protease